ncbi:hypothetical protein MGN70_013929 [Eutypa lata]|nr:hypothetical protein MGN70_013929 [Eutypa lata]
MCFGSSEKVESGEPQHPPHPVPSNHGNDVMLSDQSRRQHHGHVSRAGAVTHLVSHSHPYEHGHGHVHGHGHGNDSGWGGGFGGDSGGNAGGNGGGSG